MLSHYPTKSYALESLEQQYAAEVLKLDADEDLLKRLERGIRGLKGVAEPTDQCAVGTHFQIQFEDSFSNRAHCGFCASFHDTKLYCFPA